MFSSRVPTELTLNRLTRAARARRAAGRSIVDLTESNPTRAGLRYPNELLAALCSAQGLDYDPRPFGAPAARAAVAVAWSESAPVDPERVVLTATSSESYSILFKLLCDPGDQVLVPRPSYPLLEHLSALEGVRVAPYPLVERQGRWEVELSGLEARVSPRTRALLAVSPNNPTGSFLSPGEIQAMASLCARRDLALIGDEVFHGYVLADGQAARPSVLVQDRALTFSLGGLSKAAGLPQLKLGWIVVGGPPELVRAALDRLELICDNYLSVATPVQLGAAALLAHGAGIRRQILERVRSNHAALGHRLRGVRHVRLLDAEGGWYAVIQLPPAARDEDVALRLLEEQGVLVHPGYYYDFEDERHLVLSLLPRADRFRAGVEGLALALAGRAAP